MPSPLPGQSGFSEEQLRDYATRFMTLPETRKRQIARELGAPIQPTWPQTLEEIKAAAQIPAWAELVDRYSSRSAASTPQGEPCENETSPGGIASGTPSASGVEGAGLVTDAPPGESAASTPQGEPCENCLGVDPASCFDPDCSDSLPVEGREWMLVESASYWYSDIRVESGPRLKSGERIRVREVPEEGE